MSKSYKEKLFESNNLAFSLHQEKQEMARELEKLREELLDARNQAVSVAAQYEICHENYNKLMRVVTRFIEKYEPDYDLFDALRPF